VVEPRARPLRRFPEPAADEPPLQPGDRVVAVLRVIKELGRQIDYGSARDVSDQSLAQDAGEPLLVTWRASSYLDLPIALPPVKKTP